MRKRSALVGALLWTLLLIVFPISSGILAAIFELSAQGTRLLQTLFMLLSLVPVLFYVIHRRMRRADLLLQYPTRLGLRMSLYCLPLFLILLPMILRARMDNLSLSLLTLLFTLSVGLSEEMYFRGVLLNLLRRAFPLRAVILLGALYFGLAHLAGAFVYESALMLLLHIVNALLFGWLAMSLALLTESILPLIFFHAFFDFFTYHLAAQGELLVGIYFLRGMGMTLYALYLMGKLLRGYANRA